MKLRQSTLLALKLGAAIGLLNVLITSFYISDRPIGASTSYPYIMGWLLDLKSTVYFKAIAGAGSWEMWFIFGGLIGSFCIAVRTKKFNVSVVPKLWGEYQGQSKVKRLIWSFSGGFILILGARIADGCASGHILSGNMEMAVSSFVFALCVGLSYFVFTKYFYKRG